MGLQWGLWVAEVFGELVGEKRVVGGDWQGVQR